MVKIRQRKQKCCDVILDEERTLLCAKSLIRIDIPATKHTTILILLNEAKNYFFFCKFIAGDNILFVVRYAYISTSTPSTNNKNIIALYGCM